MSSFGHHAKCQYAECYHLPVMLSVVIVSIIMMECIYAECSYAVCNDTESCYSDKKTVSIHSECHYANKNILFTLLSGITIVNTQRVVMLIIVMVTVSMLSTTMISVFG